LATSYGAEPSQKEWTLSFFLPLPPWLRLSTLEEFDQFQATDLLLIYSRPLHRKNWSKNPPRISWPSSRYQDSSRPLGNSEEWILLS
jgi:hypothetical protein